MFFRSQSRRPKLPDPSRRSVDIAQIPVIDRLNLGCLPLDRRLDPFLYAAGECQDRPESRAALTDAAVAAEEYSAGGGGRAPA